MKWTINAYVEGSNFPEVERSFREIARQAFGDNAFVIDEIQAIDYNAGEPQRMYKCSASAEIRPEGGPREWVQDGVAAIEADPMLRAVKARVDRDIEQGRL